MRSGDSTVDLSVAVPYYVKLSRPSGWRRVPDNDYGFHIVRLHFVLRKQPEVGRLYRGSPLADVTVEPDGASSEVTVTREERVHVVDEREAFTESLVEHEALSAFAGDLSASLLGGLAIGPSIKANVTMQEKLVSSISQRFGTRSVSTSEKTKTFTGRYTIPSSAERSYLVPSYRRRQFNVYLEFIDHLVVEYSKKSLLSPRSRTKIPPANGVQSKSWSQPRPKWRNAPNVIEVHWPLFMIQYWELVPDYCQLLKEGYDVEVSTPEDVEFLPFDTKRAVQHPLRASNVLSLYQLAERAFPRRWDPALAASASE